MKPSEQRLSEVCRQQTEAIVARHLHELFKRLPMLSGFWLRPDLKVAGTERSRSPVGPGITPAASWISIMRLASLVSRRKRPTVTSSRVLSFQL
jgi:hypothetical protein